MGRPAGFAVVVALPGTFNSTKRFIKATRAAGASRSNDSLLRAVRYRENPVASWEHAACKTSRSAAAGPFAATGTAVVTVCALGRRYAGQIGPTCRGDQPGRDDDSCARVSAAKVVISKTNAIKPNDHGDACRKDVSENLIQTFAGLNISARFCVKLDRGMTSSQPAFLACSANSLCT